MAPLLIRAGDAGVKASAHGRRKKVKKKKGRTVAEREKWNDGETRMDS